VWSAYLNVPIPLPETVKAEFVRNLRSVHRIRQVLLVRKNEEEGIAEFVFVEHPLQLLAGLGYTFPVITIDDEDNALAILEVFSRCEAGKGAGKKLDTQCFHSKRILP
jgi:hypothetical protein